VPEPTTSSSDPARAPLGVEVARADGEIVLSLSGELDPHTAPLLRDTVDQLEPELGSTTLVFDLSSLRFIDSSGLRVVISAHRLMEERDGRLVLRSPSATARRILSVTGLADQIAIED
jgi:anti-sigma B factor antagonist